MTTVRRWEFLREIADAEAALREAGDGSATGDREAVAR